VTLFTRQEEQRLSDVRLSVDPREKDRPALKLRRFSQCDPFKNQEERTVPRITGSDPVDLTTPRSRAALARLLSNLFTQWRLSPAEQANLLGLPYSRRGLLAKYRRGAPLANTRDMLDRAGWLLGIHKALRLLYPHNEALRHSWVKRRNRDFDNFAPLEIMMRDGMIGLAKVSRYLDMERKF
jgi:hypothetical protein